MVNTYLRHWPQQVPLRLYTEGFDCDVAGIETVDLAAAAPWLEPWKAARTKEQRGMIPPIRKRDGLKVYTYRTDAVRFSHKVAALGAAVAEDVDVLIWLDADIVTHSPVTVDWLEELFPAPAAVAWLDRERKYPECGFMMFRLPTARGVLQEVVLAYQTGAIFRYPETHDSYVIQQIVEAAVGHGEITLASLSGEARKCGHPFVAGRLGERLDHLKGTARKERGRSFQSDLGVGREEAYWR